MKTLTAAVLILTLPGLVLAGGYGYQSYYQPYYYYPQYYPVKYPVAVYEPVKVVAYTASYVEPQQAVERVIEKTTTTTKEVIQTEAVSQAATQQVQTQKVTKDCHGVADLAAELKTLREEVARLRGNAGPAPPGTPAPAPGGQPSLMQTKCAACHAADNANAKGGGFVLTEKDGTPSVLSLPDKQRAVRRVSNGQMPPPGNKEGIAPLTEEEKKAFLDHFTK